MNRNRQLDRRIQHTRSLLQETLFHLIIERGGYECIAIAYSIEGSREVILSTAHTQPCI